MSSVENAPTLACLMSHLNNPILYYTCVVVVSYHCRFYCRNRHFQWGIILRWMFQLLNIATGIKCLRWRGARLYIILLYKIHKHPKPKCLAFFLFGHLCRTIDTSYSYQLNLVAKYLVYKKKPGKIRRDQSTLVYFSKLPNLFVHIDKNLVYKKISQDMFINPISSTSHSQRQKCWCICPHGGIN